MYHTAVIYWPLAVFLIVTMVFGVVILSVGWFFRPRRPSDEKAAVYECGNDPVGDPNLPQFPRYYFFAMLLVLFDVEVLFLVPWALHAKSLGPAGLAALFPFILVLAMGYGYLWRKGDLEWE